MPHIPLTPPRDPDARLCAGEAGLPSLDRQAADYDLVKRAVRFLSEHRSGQPTLDALAAAMGVSPGHCQKVFRRWCGLTPKSFLAALTLDHAKRLLDDNSTVLEAALDSGLTGPSRLHDLFVDFETMPPGVYKTGCAGLTFATGLHPTPFGEAVAVVRRGTSPSLRKTRDAAIPVDRLAGMAFVDVDEGRPPDAILAEFQARWPKAAFEDRPDVTRRFVAEIFSSGTLGRAQAVRVVLIGTDFEVRVWDHLRRVPLGGAVSYAGLAEAVASKRAARAVGRAVGRNPLSFVVPCHRVLQSGGGLGGYHWGLTRKRALIGWEAGQLGKSPFRAETG